MRTSLLALCVTLALAPVAHSQQPLVFKDAGDEAGLFPAVGKIAGHGVAWGDADGDGWVDLYVGTFGGAPYGSKPNQFFRNVKGKFQLDPQEPLRILGRANGGLFADFDNDGDLDLYVTNHAIDGGKSDPHYAEPNHLFRNEGAGLFTDVSKESNCCPAGIAARSASVTDFDGDGLLDLVVGECFFQGGQSRSRLYRNLGGFKFGNVSQSAGLPVQLTGFGTAAGDVNGDGWPDLYFGGRHHGTRLFLNDGKGGFAELPKNYGEFVWKLYETPDDTVCGCTFGDVNRDGLVDILIGSHCDRPWFTGGVPVRLFLNRGVTEGMPKFEDVTERVGLVPLPMKSPHVEIQDFDNDGWPDIYTSIVKFDAQGKPHPVIFRGMGSHQGLPQFATAALSVNDFPTELDKKDGDVGPFFDRMQKEHKIVYTAPGPSGDYNRDGKLDLFLANWWVDDRSLLLKNETPGGHWLEIGVEGPQGTNRQGIGADVRIYPAGKLGERATLLGQKEIAVGYGYASGQEAISHFGLGPHTSCDVEVSLPHGKGTIVKRAIAADQRIVIKK
jgi:enediyne biosynthesis protein E4